MLVFSSQSRYLLLGTHQLSLRSFEGALVYLGENDIDSDEVQCIVANLIERVRTHLHVVFL